MPVKASVTAQPRYHEGAPAWYVRAAREALPVEDFPDTDDLAPGGHAVFVAHGGENGRASVQLSMDSPQKCHTWRPKSAGPGKRWDALVDGIAACLEAAGFTDVRRTNMGVWATPPNPADEEVEFLLTPDADLENVGVYHLTSAQYPKLTARIDGGFHRGVTSGSGGFVAFNSEGTPVTAGYRTADGALRAARDYAAYCGIPDHLIKIVTVEDKALALLDAAYDAAGPGAHTATVTADINSHRVTEQADALRLEAGVPAESAEGFRRERQKRAAKLIALAMATGGGTLVVRSRYPDRSAAVRGWVLASSSAEPMSEAELRALAAGAQPSMSPKLT
ncbi:hypothetical protein [Streptomyces sp. SAI-090]|jgi:hypothetical protein|uniref:hypothetical protein n=1 Tax=Streptomyces sp. SAI-090 TaxID=2940545 RepID=UPI0024766ED0|nr:hypothetical protein [Streptomyces sp. SAI-090]MDH6522438.1 hypothetical protein [Streptomyces sp. SAI-090]